jgi:hypothetical protein
MAMGDLEYGDVDVDSDSKRYHKTLAGATPNDQLYDHDQGRRRRGGLRGLIARFMGLLVEYGVEERGIQPRPEDVRRLFSSEKSRNGD